MSEAHLDDLDHYNFDQRESVYTGGKSGGKRSKAETRDHKNHHDPSGHTRKIVTKLQNTEKNNKLRSNSQSEKEEQTEKQE